MVSVLMVSVLMVSAGHQHTSLDQPTVKSSDVARWLAPTVAVTVSV